MLRIAGPVLCLVAGLNIYKGVRQESGEHGSRFAMARVHIAGRTIPRFRRIVLSRRSRTCPTQRGVSESSFRYSFPSWGSSSAMSICRKAWKKSNRKKFWLRRTTRSPGERGGTAGTENDPICRVSGGPFQAARQAGWKFSRTAFYCSSKCGATNWPFSLSPIVGAIRGAVLQFFSPA